MFVCFKNYFVCPRRYSGGLMFCLWTFCSYPDSAATNGKGAPREKYISGWFLDLSRKIDSNISSIPLILTVGNRKSAKFGLDFWPSGLWGALVFKRSNYVRSIKHALEQDSGVISVTRCANWWYRPFLTSKSDDFLVIVVKSDVMTFLSSRHTVVHHSHRSPPFQLMVYPVFL